MFNLAVQGTPVDNNSADQDPGFGYVEPGDELPTGHVVMGVNLDKRERVFGNDPGQVVHDKDGSLNRQADHLASEIQLFGRQVGFEPIAAHAETEHRPAARARGQRRAPRRAPRRAAAQSIAPSGADGPPAPEPPRPSRTRQIAAPAAVGAILISDANAFAACGLLPRQFRAFVRKRGLPYASVARRMLVRADVLLAALGLEAPSAPAAIEPVVPIDHLERVRLRLVGGGGK